MALTRIIETGLCTESEFRQIVMQFACRDSCRHQHGSNVGALRQNGANIHVHCGVWPRITNRIVINHFDSGDTENGVRICDTFIQSSTHAEHFCD